MLSSPRMVGGVGSTSQLISVLGSHLCRCLRLPSLCHGACALAGLILTRIPASAPCLLTTAFSHAPLPWMLFAPLIFEQLNQLLKTLTSLHGPECGHTSWLSVPHRCPASRLLGVPAFLEPWC